MIKIFKRITALILSMVMLISVIPMSAFAAEIRKTVDSGFCGADGGNNLTWTFYDDGELVISGEGKMDWYNVDLAPQYAKYPPWYPYYDKIDVITVEEGVTSIGHHAFTVVHLEKDDYAMYYKISLPKSLEYYEGHMIEDNAEARIPGRHLAYCYAGTKSEWSNIKKQIVSFKWDEKGNTPKNIVYSYTIPAYVPEGKCEALYYNGEEPEAFCEIIKWNKDNIDIVAHYYSSEREAEKIIWYTILNGEKKKVGEISAVKYESDDIRLPRLKDGDSLYLKIEMVDAEGKVIAESEDYHVATIPVDDRTFKEKVEYFFASVNFTIFFFTWFLIIPTVLGPIITPISLLIDFIRGEFKK